MRALVTGATGFVGAAVARLLLADGWQVRALTRPGADRTNLSGLDIEIAEGDLTEPASLPPALEQCTGLFHVAADYRLGVRNHAQLYRTNVDGTGHLLVAARQAGVKRIVYTSSVATLGIPKGGLPGNEDTPVSVTDMIGHYKRSKFLAEEVVRNQAAAGLPVVIVNPSTPVGPRDVKPTPTGKIILDAARGRLPAFVDTGLNIAHVDDVARGHLLAYRHGQPGERYVLGGEDMTLREILAQVARLTGRSPPRVRLPHAAVMPIAYLSETFAALTCSTAKISVESVRMSRKLMYFSSAKAQRELGYSWRPPVQAFADAIAWFATHGRLPPGALKPALS